MLSRLIVVFLCQSLALSLSAKTPRFEDYRVAKVHLGRVMLPEFGDPSQYEGTDLRCFTDSKLYAQMPVNFAGHFVVGACSCGTGCHYLFMWDALTGKFYRDFPFGPIDVVPFGVGAAVPPVESTGEQFRADSTLLILDGCIEDTCDCATRYYKWLGTHFKLILRRSSRTPLKCGK